MNDREIFQRNLNYYLNQSGKMQRDLADYVGAKYTTVSGWTRGISYPRADSMEKIANFFGIPTSQLIGERSDNTYFSPDEKRLVTAYREADDGIKKSVRKLLDIDEPAEKDAASVSGQTA